MLRHIECVHNKLHHVIDMENKRVEFLAEIMGAAENENQGTLYSDPLVSTIIVRIEDRQINEPALVECSSVREAIQILQEMIGVDKRTVMQKYMESKKEKLEKFTGPVYGWDEVDGKLRPNKDQQQVIRVMRTLYESGTSYRKIAKTLNERGIKGARGGNWQSSSVSRTIHNELHERAKEFEP